MEDIFLNADIRLVQDEKYAGKPIVVNQQLFEELSKTVDLSKVVEHTSLAMAYEKLDNIKESLSLFYVTKPPINRRERRARAREIKRKILCFKDFCDKNGISIEKITD